MKLIEEENAKTASFLSSDIWLGLERILRL
jgi:hypothetical protein